MSVTIDFKIVMPVSNFKSHQEPKTEGTIHHSYTQCWSILGHIKLSHLTQLDGDKKQKQKTKTKQNKETACFQLLPSPVINAIKIQFEYI